MKSQVLSVIYIKRKRISIMANKWLNEEIIILKKEYPLGGAKRCMKLLNRGISGIVCKAGDLGISVNKDVLRERIVKNVESLMKKRKIKESKIVISNYFKIDSKEKAYILGLLWGDGNLVKGYKDDKYLGFTMIKKDFEEIKKFFKSFEEKTKWKVYFRKRTDKTRNYKDSVDCRLHDKILTKFLILFDFDKKSTANIDKILKIIPENLLNYWWRGYLDADGCLTVRSGSGSHGINFSSNYEQDWGGHESFLNLKFKIKPSIYRTVSLKQHKHSCLVVRKYTELLTFLNYIYKDYDKNEMGLKRKYKKYLKIKEIPKFRK